MERNLSRPDSLSEQAFVGHRRIACTARSARANICRVISVRKENVEKALDEIDRGGQLGVPQKRRSTKHCLLTRDGHYPPKYVLMRAYIIQTGIKPIGLIGGPPSNTPLETLGYEIKKNCGCGNKCHISN